MITMMLRRGWVMMAIGQATRGVSEEPSPQKLAEQQPENAHLAHQIFEFLLISSPQPVSS